MAYVTVMQVLHRNTPLACTVRIVSCIIVAKFLRLHWSIQLPRETVAQ